MVHLRRLWLIALVVLVVFLVSGDGTTQQTQPADQLVDVWQFPQLTRRKAFQRWWWVFQQRAYPLDDIPTRALLQAQRQIAEAKAKLSPTSQPVSGDRWENIGPAPILGGQIGATGGTRPMSGRVADIAVDPTDANHWLIGGAQGGIWETRDAGTIWTPMTDSQASLAMGAVAFAPSNSTIIYAGTGEAAFSGDAYAGAGLLKSTDGGNTWQLLATSTFAKTAFSDLKVHPTNPNVVLAAITAGIAGRGGIFPPSLPARGIFKSSDGGVSWSQELSGEATDLEIDSGNFSNQYAGIGNPFGSSANGVYRSTDAGETWTLITGPWSTLPGGIGRVELAIAPSNANVLYVSIQDNFNNVGDDGGLLGLWRTDNAFATTPTWVQIPTGATDNGAGIHGYCGWDQAFSSDSDQCWYDHELIVDPTNVSTLYAGGVPLWRCTNCGAAPTWTEVSQTASNPANGIHVDQHSMAWAGNRLIVGNDGGVWSTTNSGTTWTDHNTNLSLTQIYEGSIHPTNPNFALAGVQDNGTQKWTGTDDWPWIGGGDGADNAISSSDPNNDWAISFQDLSILRTTNGGTSFITADSGINKTGVPFIARFEKCPANDDIFIAGTDNLWRSTNFFSAGSPSWSSNSPEMGSGISALAFASSDTTCNTYAFGTANGQLRLTTTGGSSWVNIDLGNAVPSRYVTDLVFHPTNVEGANTLYVTLSGFAEGTPGQPGHVFRTTNALAASPIWTNVSPPVNLPHNTIVLDSFAPNIVYVGTDLGVWKSTNDGGAWTHMGPETGMPNVAVFELQINHGTDRLVAFTHGRGAFVLTAGCSYAIAPTNQSFGASGGGGSVGVTAPVGCSWTAVSNVSWITISGGSNGSGNGTVNYSVAANTSTSLRSGTLTIAGQTFTVTQAGADGTPWALVPGAGATLSGPAAAIYNGELTLVVRGTDNGIYYTKLSAGAWTGWASVGGLTPSEPAAVEFNGELWAFVRGTDDRIYSNRFNGVSWSGWGEVPGGGLTRSGPGAVVLNSELSLFVRGTDDRVYQNRLTAVGWTGWAEVPGGGVTSAGPTAVVFEGTLYLVVRGSNDRIYHNLLTLSGWTGWAEVPGGGLTPSGPTAAVFSGELWYVVRGTNNRIYQNRRTAGGSGIWTGWSEVSGNGSTPSKPGAAATASTLYLAVQGTDNSIYFSVR